MGAANGIHRHRTGGSLANILAKSDSVPPQTPHPQQLGFPATPLRKAGVVSSNLTRGSTPSPAGPPPERISMRLRERPFPSGSRLVGSERHRKAPGSGRVWPRGWPRGGHLVPRRGRPLLVGLDLASSPGVAIHDRPVREDGLDVARGSRPGHVALDACLSARLLHEAVLDGSDTGDLAASVLRRYAQTCHGCDRPSRERC